MDLYRVFEQIDGSPLAGAIKDSAWLFPGIESAHLLALAMLGGAVLMLDLRLLGVGLTAQPPSAVEREARPWLIAALTVMVATGALIAVSEALKLYDKPAFWVKMTALALALAFTFAVKLPLAARDVSGVAARLLAAVSIGLWLTVAMAGRWIGFS